MKVIRMCIKCIMYIYYLLKFRSHSVAFNFANYHFPIAAAKNIQSDGRYLKFINSNNKISKGCVKNYKGEYVKLAECLANEGLEVISTNGGSFKILIDGSVLNINSASNLVTLQELFLEKIYALKLLGKSYVVMDIGMNVGFAAIYFSKYKNIKKIYSYEPFPDTYIEAHKNFELNKNDFIKIEPLNKGVSDNAKTINVPKMNSGDGGASINADILKNNNTLHLSHINIETIPFNETLENIIQNNSNDDVIVKMDCEGEEYVIFESIKNKEINASVKIFIIEWHLKGPYYISSILQNNNFEMFMMNKPDNRSGMIYAFRK